MFDLQAVVGAIVGVLLASIAWLLISMRLRADATARTEAQAQTRIDAVGAELQARATELERVGSQLSACTAELETARTQLQSSTAAEAALQLELQSRTAELGATMQQSEIIRVQAEATREATEALLSQLERELRTQMNSVVGMMELLLETHLTALQQEYLEDVRATAGSLATAVNDFLDLCRIQGGRFVRERLDFPLRDTLSHTINTVVVLAQRRRVQLQHVVAGDIPDSLIGDPGRLRQILLALLSAVLDSMEGGEVNVEVSSLASVGDQTDLRFTILQSGHADAQRLSSIFEPRPATAAAKGTHLAALLCRRSIELMEGKLEFEQLDDGTALHFTTSFDLQPRGMVFAEKLNPSAVRNLPVLVICDREARQRDLCRMLTNYGMAPKAAYDAQSALEMLSVSENRNFRLAIIDSLPTRDDPFKLAVRLREQLPEVRTILLVSVGMRGDITRCRDAGVSAYVTRPITQSDLLDSIMTVTASNLAEGTVITRHILRQSKRRLRILLAEDNSVNQTIGLSILEDRGHSVVLARNGKEALQAYQRGVFDLLLTDLQMPELDGFELMAAIRDLEQRNGKHLPIIAVTAHGMKGERERCLRAGMDGYVSKPLYPKELFEEMDAVLENAGAMVAKNASPASRNLIDSRVALENCAGNMKVVQEKANQLLDGIDGDIRRLEAAIKVREWAALRSNATEIGSRWEEVGATSVALQLSNLASMAETQPVEAIEEAFGRVSRVIEDARAMLGQVGFQGQRRILIAEDDTISSMLLEDMLVGWGYEVELASDGLEAWRILQADDPPRLAILDWMMPKMDGVQVCREVRRWREEPYIYIMLLTTRSEKEDIIQGLDGGADDYLVKPFDGSELKVRLRAGLRIIELQEELICARDTMKHQATHDALTGVLNRRALLDSITHELNRIERQGGDLAVVLLDLDHFKKINDTYGHQAGDAVLREAARRLKMGLHPYDVVGRYGGEEFVVALPGCDMKTAGAHAERLRRRLCADPVLTLEGAIPMSASIGVCSTSMTDRRDGALLLRAADMALYRAKHDGRNCVRAAGPDDFALEPQSV